METIFNPTFERAKLQAVQFGGTVVSGVNAISTAANRVPPRNINLGMWADGDVAEIPAYPVAGSPKDTDDQWLCKPLNRGGDPVISVLCKVTTKAGTTVVKELFAGTLVKSAINNDTNLPESASGQVPTALADKESLESLYKEIAGKKIKFSNPKTFKTTRRDFRGNGPDRVSNTTVFQIDWA